MVEFKSLSIKNFMSLREVNLDLSGNEGFILIDAENHRKEDNAASNGSGKSSVFESLVWCITGETIRGYKDVVNKYQSEDCVVKVSFDFKGSRWDIERTRRKSGGQGLRLWKDERELEYKGLRDAEDVLSRQLPELTMKFLGSTVVLGQGLPQRFTNNSPSGRKAVLEELSNADYMISHVKENIKRREQILQGELRKTQDSILSCETKLKMLDDRILSDNKKLEDLRRVNLDEENKRLQELVDLGKVEAARHEKLEAEVTEARENVLKAVNEESNIKDTLNQRLQAVQEKYNSMKLGIKDSFLRKSREALQSFETEILEESDKERDLKEAIAHAEATLSGGVCRLCGQKLQNVTEATLEAAKITKEEKTAALKIVKDRIDSLEIKRKSLSERLSNEEKSELAKVDECLSKEKHEIEEDLYKALLGIKERLEKLRGIQAEIESAEKSSYQKLQELRVDYKSQKTKIDTHVERLSEIEKSIEENLLKTVELKETLESQKSLCETLQERLKVIKSMETFASRDFRGILLEDIISELDAILKKNAERVYGDPLTEFYQEGNSIGISFDGKEYEALSGGEKQKLDVLIQLSLRELIIRTNGVECNLAVFDEVFDGLDGVGCSAIIQVLSELGLKTFVITHHKELPIPYDYVWTVVKNPDGLAYVELR